MFISLLTENTKSPQYKIRLIVFLQNNTISQPIDPAKFSLTCFVNEMETLMFSLWTICRNTCNGLLMFIGD